VLVGNNLREPQAVGFLEDRETLQQLPEECPEVVKHEPPCTVLLPNDLEEAFEIVSLGRALVSEFGVSVLSEAFDETCVPLELLKQPMPCRS
jgi:hypothetical protein